ncbi:MAG: hypothetical protein Q8K77_08600, partial [Thermodesulfovibrionales bacterium]|nr:hypothetical protein [Thermodesulfovibrionales bacterium]
MRRVKDIDYSILPEAFTPMYKIHKYWGRKPWNIFRDYIKNYTSENDKYEEKYGILYLAKRRTNMAKRILMFVLVAVFLMTSTIPAMAGDKSGCDGKNVLQCMYDWFGGCDKA